MLTLDVLDEQDVERVREWRNLDSVALGLRTAHRITGQEQDAFFSNVVANPRSPHRYYRITSHDDGYVSGGEPVIRKRLAGMGGLTNIGWEAGYAEISLLIDPARQGEGLGGEAVELLLTEAFQHLRLGAVYGECYACNPALGFWQGVVAKSLYEADGVMIPRRTWRQGKWQDAYLFWWLAP